MKTNTLSTWLLWVALDIFTAINVVHSEDLHGDDLLHKVEQLDKSARIAVLIDGAIRIVDVAQPANEVADRKSLLKDREWSLLGSSNDGVYFGDGSRVYCLDSSGESRSVLSINGNASRFGKRYVGRADFPFRSSKRNEAFCFELADLGGRDLFTREVCRVSRDGAPMGRVPLPSNSRIRTFDYNVESETVYALEGLSVIVRKFSDRGERRLRLSEAFDYCELSPDGRKLLLFNSGISSSKTISVIDLGSGMEKVVSARGSHATWLSNGSIVFLEDFETTLSRCNIDSGNVERLLSHVCDRAATLPSPKSYVYSREVIERSPKVSPDGRLVCWAYADESAMGALVAKYTLIADLTRTEYLIVNDAWWNAMWFHDGRETEK